MRTPTKLAVAFLVLLAVGVPVLETWEALLLAALWLGIVFGACRPGRWRLAAAAAIVAAVAGAERQSVAATSAGVKNLTTASLT